MSWPECIVACVAIAGAAYVGGQFWKAMSS